MKMKFLFFSAAVALTATTAFAQSVEYDDMYFNSKDRQKLKEKQASKAATFSQSPASKHNQNNAASEVYADNGSYSARNQNPEFAARSNSTAAADDAEYFSSNYSYSNASDLQNWNNNYNNWYSSPWVATNYWGSSIYGWNSPYYGSYYDSWGNPWMNPYYRSGWSSSFSMYMGNSWNYGWGGGFGMGFGYAWGNPYYNSWASWGPSFGYGYGFGGGYYGYPSVVIINNDYGRNYAYGKRGSQNGMVTRRQSVNNANGGLRPTVVPTGGSRPTYNGSSGGRVATTPTTSTPSRGQGQRQDDYYNRNWRTSRQADAYGGGSYSQPSRSSQSGGWNNSNNSSQSQWNRSGGNDNGRSGYSGGSSSPTRSSAPASSGSGGRTRGRD